MDREAVAKKVRKAVAGVFHVSEKKLAESTDFIDDLHAKSIDIIELLAALELEFGFRIPQGDARKNRTLRQAIDYMHKRAMAVKK